MFALPNQPKNIDKGEILLLQLNKRDCSSDSELRARINYALVFDRFENDENGEISRKYWPNADRTWPWILYASDVLKVKPFSLENLPLNRESHYQSQYNPLKIDPGDEQIILKYLPPWDEKELTNPIYSLYQCSKDTYMEEALLEDWMQALNRKRQAILYGPPGTGKTYLAEHLAKHLLSNGDGFLEIIQFHPAYTYEDFVQGIRPKQGENGGLEYPVEAGRFFTFCQHARQCQSTCVLVIDEINRADLSQVFGEIMYLLEYRDKEVKLASNGQLFSIPKNVRIIGTMNTADRSIALVDHALRRRFAFLRLEPQMDILRQFHANSGLEVEGLIKVLERVNKTIDNPQYVIGTSFFLHESLRTELRTIWLTEIEPYLEEYFFDQPDKVKDFKWEQVKSELVL